jgi:uncharacterized protein (DUF3084 family)
MNRVTETELKRQFALLHTAISASREHASHATTTSAEVDRLASELKTTHGKLTSVEHERDALRTELELARVTQRQPKPTSTATSSDTGDALHQLQDDSRQLNRKVDTLLSTLTAQHTSTLEQMRVVTAKTLVLETKVAESASSSSQVVTEWSTKYSDAVSKFNTEKATWNDERLKVAQENAALRAELKVVREQLSDSQHSTHVLQSKEIVETIKAGFRGLEEKTMTPSTLPTPSSSTSSSASSSSISPSSNDHNLLVQVARDVSELKFSAHREREKLTANLGLAHATLEEKNKALTVWRSKYEDAAARYV